MGILYIVATPIGNLKDITLRAIEVLSRVDLIVCEDTRRTGKLLKSLKLAKRPLLVSMTDYNESGRALSIIGKLQAGENVALVSDAGSPLFSDPGFPLVKAALDLGIRVEAIPGPSSAIAAVQVSGFPADRVLIWGFLPKKDGDKKAVFRKVAQLAATEPMTFVFFESPYRLNETLLIASELIPLAEVSVSRELTKIHEISYRGKLAEVAGKLPAKMVGEVVLLMRI